MAESQGKTCMYVMRSFAHFIYHESTLAELVRRGVRLQVVFDPCWSKGRSDAYVNEWLKANRVEEYSFFPNRNDSWRGFLFHLREVSNLGSYLTRKGQSPFYLKRWEGYQHPRLNKLIKTPVVGRMVKALIAVAYRTHFLRLIEGLVPPDKNIIKYLQQFNPDVVVVSPSNLRYSEEIEVLKAAKALQIRTVVPVLTWDNLTTKGLLQIEPDLVLAWNEAHRTEAIQIHRISKKRISLTGSPFFDKWFEADKDYPVEECRQRAGLPQGSPFITYLGSSANIAKDESGLVDKLANGFLSDEATKNWSVLVRTHPANSYNFNKCQAPNVSCWPKPLDKPGELSLPETPEAHEDFQFALKECVAIVGINTSAMIEGLINDRPVVALLLEAFSKTQSEASHFQQLLDNDVLYLAKSTKECLALLKKIAEGYDPKKEQRHRFVAKYIRLNGQSAGGQQASKILEMSI